MIKDWNKIVKAYDNAGNELEKILIGNTVVWQVNNDENNDNWSFHIINYKIGDYPAIVESDSYMYTEGRQGNYGNACVAVDVMIYFNDKSKMTTLTYDDIHNRYWQILFNHVNSAGYKVKYVQKYSKNAAIYRFYIDVLSDTSFSKYYLELFDLYPYSLDSGKINTDILTQKTYMYTDANKTSKLLFNGTITNTKSVNYDPTADEDIDTDMNVDDDIIL